MLKLILRILVWLRGGSLNLLLVAGAILIIWGILSPVGTIIWWLGQNAESLGLKKTPPEILPSNNVNLEARKSSPVNCYIIFLPGVGDFSGDELTRGETFFLKRLVESHPQCVAVSDIFPYSASNKSLGGERLLAPFWRFAEHAKSGPIAGDILIKIRNLWRFAISLDYRYGQAYNQGIANVIIERMNAKYSISQTPKKPFKVILIGTSGGAQVALGATHYLKQWLKAEITVVSVGGVFSGENGFADADRIFHFRGSRDSIEDIGGIVFPTRWYWFVTSPFNQARLENRYTEALSGPHQHDGDDGYFGENRVADGQKYVDITLDKINQLPIWPSDFRF
jgi:predicted esterase